MTDPRIALSITDYEKARLNADDLETFDAMFRPKGSKNLTQLPDDAKVVYNNARTMCQDEGIVKGLNGTDYFLDVVIKKK